MGDLNRGTPVRGRKLGVLTNAGSLRSWRSRTAFAWVAIEAISPSTWSAVWSICRIILCSWR